MRRVVFGSKEDLKKVGRKAERNSIDYTNLITHLVIGNALVSNIKTLGTVYINEELGMLWLGSERTQGSE